MNNKQVALNWAARVYQGQDASRARTPHMFYDGDTIYSYGYYFPIARYHAQERVTLLNSRTYSVTTSRHQSHVRGVVEGERLYVPDVTGQDHAQNIAYLVSVVETREGRVLSCQMRNIHEQAEIATFAREALARYGELFSIAVPVVPQDERVTLRLIRARLVGA